MKWLLVEPAIGDMIRVKAGSIYHYGIYASDDEVIQFGLTPALRCIPDSLIEVCTSDIYTFLNGGFLEVAVFDKKEARANRKGKDVVEYARTRIGEKGYNILYNNCEHFAYECVTGKKYCSQTQNVRELFKNMPIVDVYIAPLPQGEATYKVSSAARQAAIDEANHPLLKKQRYYVWMLLEYALNRSFGLKAQKLTFTKKENGAWCTDGCYFSLSHSHNALAVAVSRKPVGVDIEKCGPVKDINLPKRVLSEAEFIQYLSLPESEQQMLFAKIWSQKESIFKQQDKDVFLPWEITQSVPVTTDSVSFYDEAYCFSVASENVDRLRLYNVKL